MWGYIGRGRCHTGVRVAVGKGLRVTGDKEGEGRQWGEWWREVTSWGGLRGVRGDVETLLGDLWGR